MFETIEDFFDACTSDIEILGALELRDKSGDLLISVCDMARTYEEGEIYDVRVRDWKRNVITIETIEKKGK